jgi:4-amino-4-deoxy-L-arabinose transferase-like glycosyltransferase
MDGQLIGTRGRRFWLGAGAALAAGLLLRLWFVRHLALVTGDSLVYGDIAKSWLAHGVYGFSGVGANGAIIARATLIRLPGYPMFLALCFRLFGVERYGAVMAVQAVVDTATCGLLGALAGRLFGGRAALAVLWLAALCPFTANYTAAPLTETLTLNAMAVAFYALLRWMQARCGLNRWLWAMGAALGWSILLRPEQGLVMAAVLPAAWFANRRSGLRGSGATVLIAALCAVLPLVPWTARNWRTFHRFEPLAPRDAVDPGELDPVGFNRWFRTWGVEFQSTEDVYWNYSGFAILISDLPERAFDAGSPQATADLRAETASLLADYNKTMVVTPAIDARFAALARERIRAHPVLCYVGLPVARLLDMMLRPRTELLPAPLDWWRWSQHRGQTVFATAYAALNLAYIVLGVAGFVVWRRRRWLAFGITSDMVEAPAAECPTSQRDVGAVSRTAANWRLLAFAMATSVLLRAALLLTLDNSEPRYTLEFFPVLLVFAVALFAERTDGARGPARANP